MAKLRYDVGGTGGGGSTTWIGLTDTPAAFVGNTLKVPQVNVAETALQFVEILIDKTYVLIKGHVAQNGGVSLTLGL